MNIGHLNKRITLDVMGTPVRDDDGGFTTPLSRLATRIPASVEPATARQMERAFAGTVTAMASHLVTLRYIPGVTLQTQVTFHDGLTDRIMNVTGKSDPAERHEQLILACEEMVQ